MARAKHLTPGQIDNRVTITFKIGEIALRVFAFFAGGGLVLLSCIPALLGTFMGRIATIWQPSMCMTYNLNLQHKLVHDGDIITIESENVAGGPPAMSTVNNLRPVYDRMIEKAGDILRRNPDILCGQELFDEDATRILENACSSQYPHTIHTVGNTGVGMNSGLFFFSKFPVINAKFVPFGNGSAEDNFANKGVLLVTVEVSEGEYMIITVTHTQSKFAEVYSGIRSEQLRLIDNATNLYVKAFVDTMGKQPIGVVAAGDYNLAEAVTDENVFSSPKELTKQENLAFLNKYVEPEETPTSSWYDQTHPRYGQKGWWDRNKNDLFLNGFRPDRIGFFNPGGGGVDLTYELLSHVDTSANDGQHSPATDHIGLRAEFRYHGVGM